MDTDPGVSVRVYSSDSHADLFRASIDIAIRFIRPEALNDANLYGSDFCNAPNVLYASPDYLEEHGIPKHPRHLRSHNRVLYQLYDVTHDTRTFTKQGEEYNAILNQLIDNGILDKSVFSIR